MWESIGQIRTGITTEMPRGPTPATTRAITPLPLRTVRPDEIAGLCTDQPPNLQSVADARRRRGAGDTEPPAIEMPRAPDAFVDWLNDLDRLDTLNPFTSEQLEALVERMKTDMEASAQTDALAQESLPHISMHRALVRRFASDLEALGVDPSYICLLGNAHDMGKFVPDAEVLRAANGDFVTGRIAWHDQSTASYLLQLGEELDLPKAAVQHLIVDIVGINEGSGEPDAFWNAHLWGDGYPLPRSREGAVAALFDRFGQGDRTGALKILKQNEKAGLPFRENVTESYRDNPKKTIRQIESIGRRLERALEVTGFSNSAIMKAARDAQAETLLAFSRLTWDGDVAEIALSDGRTMRAASVEDLSRPEVQEALFAPAGVS